MTSPALLEPTVAYCFGSRRYPQDFPDYEEKPYDPGFIVATSLAAESAGHVGMEVLR